MLRKLLPLAAITATALAASGAPAAERAGETTRVQAQSYQKTGVYPFNLRRGDEIFRFANVYTKENGSVAMLFDDGTDLTLGPNTEVTIDEYVYSPGGGGRAAISFGKGVLRMVSGRMPDENVSIDTPVATVGIRGTSFVLAVQIMGILHGWVQNGTVTAAPHESGQSHDFTAPAAFACSVSSCEQIDGAPPPPGAFPTGAGGFGFGSGARGGSDAGGHGHGGHDSGGDVGAGDDSGGNDSGGDV